MLGINFLFCYIGLSTIYIYRKREYICTKLKQDLYPISICLTSALLFGLLTMYWGALEFEFIALGIITGLICFIFWSYIAIEAISKSLRKQSLINFGYGVLAMIYIFSLLYALVNLSALPVFSPGEHQDREAHQMNQAETKSSLDPLPTTYVFASIVFAGLELCKNVRDDVSSKK